MNLSGDQILEVCGKHCLHCTRSIFSHMNMNGLVFHVGRTLLNEKIILQKYNEKNFVSRLKYAEKRYYVFA